MNPFRVRLASCLGVAALLAGTGMGVASATPRHKPAPKSISPAIQAQKLRIFNSNAWIVHLDVRKYRFGVVTAHDEIDTVRESIPSMAKRTHALAGINTDAFYWDDQTPPRGGVIRNGVRLKLQNSKHQANLYFTSDGTVHIGPTPYTLTVNNRPVSAFNNIHAIEQRRLTELTPAQASTNLPRNCTVVTLTPAKNGKYTVVSAKRGERYFRQLSKPENRALVACGSNDMAWVKRRLTPHAPVTISFAWHVPGLGKNHISMLTSGVGELVHNGREAHDHTRDFRPTGRNPETWACVSRDHFHLTLGVLDGWTYESEGISIDQLRTYMVKQGCWDGIVFDGGGSTNLVVNNKTLNQPSDGQPRPVPVGLFVYPKLAPAKK